MTSHLTTPFPSDRLRTTRQVSQAAKRALAELRKSRPDVDEMNLKVDFPMAQAPGRPGNVQQPPLMLHGGGGHLPALMGAGGPGGGIRMAALGMGAGPGMGAGAGMGMGMGVGAGFVNPFMFGAGHAHHFAPPPLGVPRPPVPMHGVAIPQPAVPLALARGRRTPPARAVATAGGGRRRKGR